MRDFGWFTQTWDAQKLYSSNVKTKPFLQRAVNRGLNTLLPKDVMRRDN